jgi:hypothetical protein
MALEREEPPPPEGPDERERTPAGLPRYPTPEERVAAQREWLRSEYARIMGIKPSESDLDDAVDRYNRGGGDEFRAWLTQRATSQRPGATGATGAPPVGTGAGYGQFSHPDFAPPTFDMPTWDYPDFEGPTAENFQTDPGYQFRLSQGQEAMQNAAASQGLLRSAGTLKDLMAHGQGLAAQEFGNVYNRKFGEWQGGLGKRLSEYAMQYGAEQDEFTRGLQTYGTNFNTAATGFGLNQDSANSYWTKLMSLYGLAKQGMPTYQPPPPPAY